MMMITANLIHFTFFFLDLSCPSHRAASTGGLIAVLLGKLELTVNEALTVYNDLMPIMFPRSRQSKRTTPRYDAEVLEHAIRDILRRHNINPDTATLDLPPHKCQIALVSKRAQTIDGVEMIFRSYYVSHQVDPTTIPIWKAVRATTATPGFFKPISIDQVEYIDGSIGCNNPALLALDEAENLDNRRVGILYSIGSGVTRYATGVVENAIDMYGFTNEELPKLAASAKKAHNDAYKVSYEH